MCRSRCSVIGLVHRALDDDVLLSDLIEELGLTQREGADTESLRVIATRARSEPTAQYRKSSLDAS
jgi:hypothetical protein